MVWVACRSGKLAVVPAYGSGSVTSRLPRHRDGTNSGTTMARPTRASTPSKSMASKPDAVGPRLQRDVLDRVPHAEQVQAGPGEQREARQPGRERGDPRHRHQHPGEQGHAQQGAEALEDGVVVQEGAAAAGQPSEPGGPDEQLQVTP